MFHAFRKAAAFALTTLVATGAEALEFSVEHFEPNLINDRALHVTISGRFEVGDADRLAALLDRETWPDLGRILLMFDSGGGSLMEGIRIGRLLASRSAVTTAQVGNMNRPDAICASACVLAYLGADYRYLSASRRIGVHKFSTDSEIAGDEAMALAQDLSGIIVSHIIDNRADPALFDRMVRTGPREIDWVDRDTLEEWRVVTGPVYAETARYVNLDGKLVLELEHSAIHGVNRMLLQCSEEKLHALVNLNEPKHMMIGDLELVIDGDRWPAENWKIHSRKNYRFLASFALSPAQARAAARAETFGARVITPNGDLFFGFEQRLQSDHLRETVEGCLDERSFELAPMTRLPNTDLRGHDLTREGIRDISFRQCWQTCLADPECVGVSYVEGKRWCWPKSSAAGRRRAYGIISAVRAD
ncbi:MAG: hypothetical protein ACQEUZ_04600 [Pseudomonadota bacterium]